MEDVKPNQFVEYNFPLGDDFNWNASSQIKPISKYADRLCINKQGSPPIGGGIGAAIF